MRHHLLPAFLLALPLLAPAAAAAQVPDPTAPARALDRLSFLEGTWEGTGWMTMGPGPRHTFSIRETARRAAGGSILVLEGLGMETTADGTVRPVHQAFAVLTWDEASGAFHLRAYRAGGGEVTDTPRVMEEGLVWGFEDPRGGRIRFTVDFSDGTWHERGEYSVDGTEWRLFMEMRLRPVADG